MNVNKFLKEEKALGKKTGLYSLTTPTEPKRTKVGIANEFQHRLKTYKTYLPSGVYIHNLLTVPKDDESYYFKRKFAVKREQAVFNELHDQRMAGKEWINVLPPKVEKAFINVAKGNEKIYRCNKKECSQIGQGHGKREAIKLDRPKVATRAMRKNKIQTRSSKGETP